MKLNDRRVIMDDLVSSYDTMILGTNEAKNCRANSFGENSTCAPAVSELFLNASQLPA